jgi:rubrerythrin
MIGDEEEITYTCDTCGYTWTSYEECEECEVCGSTFLVEEQ